MTNHEQYKQAFSAVHSPCSSSMAERIQHQMNERQKTKKKALRFVASLALCAALLTTGTVSYAADFGGIQRKLQLWIHGDQTAVTVQLDGNGGYSAEYTDENGNPAHMSGGGVATNPDGTERPLTEEELLEHLQEPATGKENGRSYLYWFDQKIDLTDQFEDGYCYVKLVHGEETRYLTITESLGYGMSETRYLSPWEFRVE